MKKKKQRLKAVAESYRNSSKIDQKNLTREQREGIKSLKKRRDNGEIVVFQTDKSAKMAVDTTGNYLRSMMPHVEKDEVISRKDHTDIEKMINAHSVCWVRFMQAGKDTADMYRIKMSMQSHNAEPACLYSLRKDHKSSTSVDGPPVRPVCDVTDGISHRLSYLLSNILEVC